MMGKTHRPTSSAWWLGTVVAANTVGAGINPVVALAGAAVAPVFAAGRWSPDADTTWLARYGHRKAIHRPRLALALTGVTLVVSLAVLTIGSVDRRLLLLPALAAAVAVHRILGHAGWCTAMAVTVGAVLAALGPVQAAWLVWAPVAGWWSHLAGDCAFGGIPISPGAAAVLRRVLPDRWVWPYGRDLYRVGWHLDTDGLIERGNRRLKERDERGLHKTKRVLPFAPTTAFMHAATGVLAVVVCVQAATGGGAG